MFQCMYNEIRSWFFWVEASITNTCVALAHVYVVYIYYQYMYVEMFDFRLLFSYLDLDHFVGICTFVVICPFDFWKLSLIGVQCCIRST